MDNKIAAVVLCAGMGSRLHLSNGANKCAKLIGSISPVEYTVSKLVKAGVPKVAVVVGYAASSVKEALKDFVHCGVVELAENPFYNKYGCNYSLSCAIQAPCIKECEKLIITEGDSLLHSDSIFQIVREETDAASLVRSPEYVDPTRSVIAMGIEGKINRYEYDTTHSGRLTLAKNGEEIIGESMQMWKFAGDTLRQLKKELEEYALRAQKGEESMLHSGVYSINRLNLNIKPVFSEKPDEWINLNTQDDLRRAENAKWLTRL